MDKTTTHKRQDTPIIRNPHTKKRLMAYELHIKTHELGSELSQSVRDATRGATPEQRTRSMPGTPDMNSLRLVKVQVGGRDYFVREDDLMTPKEPPSPSSTLVEPPTPKALLAQASLLELASIPELQEKSAKP